MPENCLVYCYSGVQSLFEYCIRFIHLVPRPGSRKTGGSIALKNVFVNEISVVNASWKHVGDISERNSRRSLNVCPENYRRC